MNCYLFSFLYKYICEYVLIILYQHQKTTRIYALLQICTHIHTFMFCLFVVSYLYSDVTFRCLPKEGLKIDWPKLHNINNKIKEFNRSNITFKTSLVLLTVINRSTKFRHPPFLLSSAVTYLIDLWKQCFRC